MAQRGEAMDSERSTGPNSQWGSDSANPETARIDDSSLQQREQAGIETSASTPHAQKSAFHTGPREFWCWKRFVELSIPSYFITLFRNSIISREVVSLGIAVIIVIFG